MAFARVGVAADGIVLVGQPNDEDNVEGSGCVIKKLRHDGFHPCKPDEMLFVTNKYLRAGIS